MKREQISRLLRGTSVGLWALLLGLVLSGSSQRCLAAGSSSDSMEPVVESAEVVRTAGVEGESTVSVVGNDSIQVNLGTMTCPGAYAEIRVTVKNTGEIAAYLQTVELTDCESERFLVSFPDISVEEEPALEGESRCTFTVVVSWDPEDASCPEGTETDTFSLRLVYGNDSEETGTEEETDTEGTGTEEETGSTEGIGTEEETGSTEEISTEEETGSTEGAGMEEEIGNTEEDAGTEETDTEEETGVEEEADTEEETETEEETKTEETAGIPGSDSTGDGNSSSSSKFVKTGFDSYGWLWYLLALASGSGLLLCVSRRRNDKR